MSIKTISATAALILAAAIITSAHQHRETRFESFRSELMPEVGKRITVEGVLKSAKLGWLVAFKGWGVYLEGSDTSRMNRLSRFNGQTVRATGTLRYFPQPARAESDEVAAVPPEHFYFDVDEASVISSSSATLSARAGTTRLPPAAHPPVVIKFREMRFGKPPLVYLYFDVTLRNTRREPRWFLLPSSLSPDAAPIGTKGGVDGVEVSAPRGAGRVVVGHFLGTGGFRALLLAAGAQVRLRLFPVSFWGDVPRQLQIEIVTAKRLRIGGEDAEAWFKVNPTTSVEADIAERADDAARIVASRSAPDNREVATLIDEDSRFKLQVQLDNKSTESPRHRKGNKRVKRTRHRVASRT